MLGPCPDVSLQTTVGMQGNMAVVQNMSGIIASKVSREFGAAMRGPNNQPQQEQGMRLNHTRRTNMQPFLGSMGP